MDANVKTGGKKIDWFSQDVWITAKPSTDSHIKLDQNNDGGICQDVKWDICKDLQLSNAVPRW